MLEVQHHPHAQEDGVVEIKIIRIIGVFRVIRDPGIGRFQMVMVVKQPRESGSDSRRF